MHVQEVCVAYCATFALVSAPLQVATTCALSWLHLRNSTVYRQAGLISVVYGTSQASLAYISRHLKAQSTCALHAAQRALCPCHEKVPRPACSNEPRPSRVPRPTPARLSYFKTVTSINIIIKPGLFDSSNGDPI